ncbi:MAG: sugar ABC transporter ATP-binding protein, partial [Actinobacteria bacterium]|nr:sugar ABC transporter ATP-binding protein [Actinomycetota bacterium]
MENNSFLLSVNNISKKFPGVQALNKINLEIKVGEVHAIVGENGAGKSTFIKILSGVYEPDEGEIYFNGKKIQKFTVNNSINLGISTIYQEVNLVKDLTVAENLFLNNLPKNKFGIINYKKLFADAMSMIESFGVNINPKSLLGNLNIGDIQLVAIIKCLVRRNNLIIMDEPTSSLSMDETETLFRIINFLKTKNISIIFITHNIDDIFKIADRVTIFRNGKKIITKDIKEIYKDEIITHMIGKEMGKIFPNKGENIGDKILEVSNLNSKLFRMNNLNFYLNKGEILGFFGLVGSGRTELFKMIYGVVIPETGVIK